MTSLDELFKDRYTMENERYAKISEGFEKVVIVHPWNTQRGGYNRNFNNRGRGGFRGNWRGGNNNQGWRGANNNQGWRGNGGGGGDRKRHYNDRN